MRQTQDKANRSSVEPGRILIMVAGDIADTLRMTPYLKAVRRRYPGSHLAVLVSERGAAALERFPHADEVIVRRISQGGMPGPGGLIAKLAYLLAVGRRLRGRFDLVLGPHNAGPLWNALAFATGAPRRVGYELQRTGFLLTQSLGRPDDKMLDEQRMERLLRAVGVSGTEDDPYLELWPSEEDERAAAALLRERGLAGQAIVALAPGSDWSCQQWQLANWAAIADGLVRRHGVRIVVLGVAGERALAERLAGHMAHEPIDLTGRTPSVGMLAAVMRSCRLTITLESAPCAVAMAVGTPLVALFGSLEVWIRGQQRGPAIALRKCAGLVPNEFTVCKLYKMGHSFHRCQQEECVAGDGLAPITPIDVLRSAETLLATRNGLEGPMQPDEEPCVA